jgi:hypothetical protein
MEATFPDIPVSRTIPAREPPRAFFATIANRLMRFNEATFEARAREERDQIRRSNF